MKLGKLVGWGTAFWAVLVSGVFLFFVWLQTGQPFHPWKFLSAAEPDEFFNAARTAATLLGVAGLGGAALIAYRRQTSTETTLHDERTKALHERYSAGAEQLGHESSAIRLAGVYALASLADDWETHKPGARERQVCSDLLCAYLRSSSQSPSAEGTDGDVRAAIVDSIWKRTRSLPGPDSWINRPEWHMLTLNLRGADLTHTKLSYAFLAFADLTTARLTRANLAGAVFSRDFTDRDRFTEQLEDSFQHRKALPRAPRPRDVVMSATLVWTSFEKCMLDSADFGASHPRWVTFNHASMRHTDFTLARVQTCDFTSADLSKALFAGATLSEPRYGGDPTPAAFMVNAKLIGADFHHAHIGHVDFTGADLSGANFYDTTGLEHANLNNVVYDDTTRWPLGFVLPPSR